MSVSHDDDHFDFNKLERELKAAVTADEKYNRENDAKLRAVHQKVASYDEFKEIVKASHLKPLEKGDKIEGKFAQPWNMHADKKKHVTDSKDSETNEEKTRVPQNSLEFVREWRKLSLDKKYHFLIEIGPEKLENIFKPEIGFGLLGDFLLVLLEVSQEELHIVLNILEGFSRTNRFSLSVQFMSSKEKEACEKLFKRIEDLNEWSDRITSLRSLYGLIK
ncbi:coiled-coil domain-containing protein 103-like [Haliotis rubra]|uniref:coiled-coil domain-containing protein 103-like n=1 Tax=Haliotis rubra TaxID=36100 RepID=UPI001EE5862A|nr:coiled-coil domain-containing protein 103-like [Haliotis rubra]